MKPDIRSDEDLVRIDAFSALNKMTKKEIDTVPEEDAGLVSELELLSMRLQEGNTSLYIPALEQLKSLIKSSTSSMTSVPKPLKYLKNHYEPLLKCWGEWKDGKEKVLMLL